MVSPYDPIPDDSTCASPACGGRLPDDPDPDSWPFNGFCGPMCALIYRLGTATWEDDQTDGSSRQEAWAATSEIRSELARLRTTGDALAQAARDGLADIRDRSPVRPPLVAALAGWAAARGGSGGEDKAEAKSEGPP